MEKLKLKGRLYLDQTENYIKVDDKGRKYVQVKLVELNQASQYGSTHVLIVDTWNAGKREEKEPTCCWLEPIKPKATALTAPTEFSAPTIDNAPIENDGLPF